MPTNKGSFKLFKIADITVYVHWSWFLILLYVVQISDKTPSSLTLSILGLLTLFLIVLMHEFGHALACKQVGGQANQIVLWPLGGVAYVAPPQRPGAMLWSIAAGPLVNVVLFSAATIFLILGNISGLSAQVPFLWDYIGIFAYINLILLKFNLLPIFPLDGGQILRSLLWFKFGKARSMMIATIIGFIGIAIMIPYIITQNNNWYYILAAFIAFNCWSGFKQAQILMRVAKIPRREGFACPSCKTAPPLGALWRCGQCGNAFDMFATNATCPHCSAQYNLIPCLDCGTRHAPGDWKNAERQ